MPRFYRGISGSPSTTFDSVAHARHRTRRALLRLARSPPFVQLMTCPGPKKKINQSIRPRDELMRLLAVPPKKLKK